MTLDRVLRLMDAKKYIPTAIRERSKEEGEELSGWGEE